MSKQHALLLAVVATSIGLLAGCRAKVDATNELERRTIRVGDIGLSFVKIEGDGSGAPSFWLLTTEVPWEIFARFLDNEEPTLGASMEFAKTYWPTWSHGYLRVEPGLPATHMSQLTARQFTKWLSEKIGEFVRLPLLEERRHACRLAFRDAEIMALRPVCRFIRGTPGVV